jgi:hypothetical protein
MAATAELDLETIPIIDVDTHVTEPADLWTSRLPSRFGDKVPHVVTEPSGAEMWYLGDRRLSGAAKFAAAGWRDYPPSYPPRYDQADSAAWDPVQRLQRMDEYGLHTQVLYPNILAFYMPMMFSLDDLALTKACVLAYNDFLADFCRVNPDRLVPLMMLPFWDAGASVAEIARAAALGHGSAKHPARPAPPAPLRYPADGSAAELVRWQREGWYRPGTLLDDFDAGAAQRPGAELVFASRHRPGPGRAHPGRAAAKIAPGGGRPAPPRAETYPKGRPGRSSAGGLTCSSATLTRRSTSGRSATGGLPPATSAISTPTATSRPPTGSRTSSSGAARTSPPRRSRTCWAATRPSWNARSSAPPTRSTASGYARSSS